MSRKEGIAADISAMLHGEVPDKVALALLLAECEAQSNREFALANTLHKLRKVREGRG